MYSMLSKTGAAKPTISLQLECLLSEQPLLAICTGRHRLSF